MKNTGALLGDEVVQVYHQVSETLRSAITKQHPGAENIFLDPLFILKMITLPRQARDKHIGNKGVFRAVPLRRLVDFQRVTVAPGEVARVAFSPFDAEAFSLVTTNGSKAVYPGGHSLVFSRGHGEEIQLNFTL